MRKNAEERRNKELDRCLRGAGKVNEEARTEKCEQAGRGGDKKNGEESHALPSKLVLR